ncbi:MAG: hypothetical protein J0H83_07830 [Candidatus Melainabacteria bacterium]|nr:hypothetical protein [Candidatus Melainabacteria bacterium]
MPDDKGPLNAPAQQANAEEDLKRKIIDSVGGNFRGEETSRWIAAIKDDDMADAEETVSMGPLDTPISEPMTVLLDKIFDHLKRYTFEYNRIQDTRESYINCERPSAMMTVADYHVMGKPIKYCLGHIASRKWALVFCGEDDRVRCYISPVEYLMGFRPDQTDFPVYVEMRLAKLTTNRSGRMVWSISGQALAEETLAVLARRFFTHLVKVIRGEADMTEKFVFDPQDLKAPPKQEMVDRSFEDDLGNGLFDKTQGKPSQQARSQDQGTSTADNLDISHLVARPQPQAQPPTIGGQQQFGQPYRDPNSDSSQRPGMPSASEMQAQAQSQADSLKFKASELLKPRAQKEQSLSASHFQVNTDDKASNQPPDINKEAAELNRKIAHSLKNLFDTVDASISGLTALGVEAMHTDDLASVADIMKRTKSLKSLRDGIVSMSKEWQKSLES